jgi:hypothetical protein
MIRQVVERLLADEHWRPVSAGNKLRRFRVGDGVLLAEDRDSPKGNGRHSRLLTSSPLARDADPWPRSDMSSRRRSSGVTLRDLIEREGEGS